MLAGSGRCDVETLKRICRDDVEALDALDKALQTASPYGGDRKSEQIKFDNVKLDSSNQGDTAPTGNTRDYALRRLRSEQPELHARVLADVHTSISKLSALDSSRTIAGRLPVLVAYKVHRGHAQRLS